MDGYGLDRLGLWEVLNRAHFPNKVVRCFSYSVSGGLRKCGPISTIFKRQLPNLEGTICKKFCSMRKERSK